MPGYAQGFRWFVSKQPKALSFHDKFEDGRRIMVYRFGRYWKYDQPSGKYPADKEAVWQPWRDLVPVLWNEWKNRGSNE